jgi:hypothetical protein
MIHIGFCSNNALMLLSMQKTPSGYASIACSQNIDGYGVFNGVKIKWQSKVKDLGNIINVSLNDDDDCNLKKGQANRMNANFKHVDQFFRIFLLWNSNVEPESLLY